jgi:hypothetical protein
MTCAQYLPGEEHSCDAGPPPLYPSPQANAAQAGFLGDYSSSGCRAITTSSSLQTHHRTGQPDTVTAPTLLGEALDHSPARARCKDHQKPQTWGYMGSGVRD